MAQINENHNNQRKKIGKTGDSNTEVQVSDSLTTALKAE